MAYQRQMKDLMHVNNIEIVGLLQNQIMVFVHD